MSTALAIASVSYVLKDLLNNGLIDKDVSGAINSNVNVTALPPDMIDATSAGQTQLNLFMYRVTFNQGWSNVDFPSRDSQGVLISNPPLPLNLHYLLTSYGAKELHSEILLGYGMQILHETPVLERKAIRDSLMASSVSTGAGLPDELRALSLSELADQVEQLRITPENLSTEEISKLWTAFSAKYRPTAAYQVSVVLIESRKSVAPALRVKKPLIYVNPFHQPVIEKILSQKTTADPVSGDQPILSGYTLVLDGYNLKGDDTRVNISGTEVFPAKDNVSDSRILVALPAGLHAGVQSVRVVHYKLMGDPGISHSWDESNIASFMLSPSIPTPPPDISVAGPVTLAVAPPVQKEQSVVLLLNELISDPSVKRPPYSYTFPLPPGNLPADDNPSVSIPINDVMPGVYLVRIRVGGAESPLDSDASGNYASPIITIS